MSDEQLFVVLWDAQQGALSRLDQAAFLEEQIEARLAGALSQPLFVLGIGLNNAESVRLVESLRAMRDGEM